MGARPYDPSIGRFLAPDPVVGGSLSIYDYAQCNPIGVYDLEGQIGIRFPKWSVRCVYIRFLGCWRSRCCLLFECGVFLGGRYMWKYYWVQCIPNWKIDLSEMRIGLRISTRLRKSLELAEGIASDHGHDAVATDHLLLGLLMDQDDMASSQLAANGLDVDTAVRELASRSYFVSDGSPDRARRLLPSRRRTPWTANAQNALREAYFAGKELGSSQIEGGHLLLAMLDDPTNAASCLLKDMNVPVAEAREQLLAQLRVGVSSAS
jgi:hypothetical protein